MSIHALHPTLPPASAPEAFTEAVIEILTAATWPDGSALVDVDITILRAQLAPQILAAAHVLAAASTFHAASRLAGGTR